MQIKGEIVEIFDTKEVGERKFKIRDFVIEYVENPQYPEMLKFQITGDNVSKLDDFKIGDNVEVDFNLKGRAWKNDKGEVSYFNTLQAWKVFKIKDSDVVSYVNNEPQQVQNIEAPVDGDDDLPF